MGRKGMLMALAALAVVGCSSSPYAKWKDLDAVYCKQVPLPGDARFEDQVGGDYYGEGFNDHTFETMSYFFTTKESPEKLEAFYQQTFPGAIKETGEDGDIIFTVKPQGAEDGEQVTIRIGSDGKIQIGEDTKPGKHKDSEVL